MRDSKTIVAGIDYPQTLQEFYIFLKAKKHVVNISGNFVSIKVDNTPQMFVKSPLDNRQIVEASTISGTILVKTRYPLTSKLHCNLAEYEFVGPLLIIPLCNNLLALSG